MKASVRAKKTTAEAPVSKTETLHKKVLSTEKSVQRALADFEKKGAAYQDALKQHADKITLLGLVAAAKIARLTYKIKRTEHKLAKATWKTVLKAEKKVEDKFSKDSIMPVSKKNGKKAPKDAADTAKSGKKKAATRA